MTGLLGQRWNLGISAWDLVLGDSLEVMRGWPDGCVDGIVTSPPYADQRAYKPGELGGRDGQQSEAMRRTRARSRGERSSAPDRWVEWIKPYTAECLRVLSPTGSMMLNLGVILRDGQEHDCVDKIKQNCRDQGWKVLHTTIWNKPNGQVPSAPGYLTIAHEYAFWLAPSTAPWRAFEQPEGSQASREVRTPHAASSSARMAALYAGREPRLHHKSARKPHRLHPDGARPTSVFTCAVGGAPNPDGHPARMPLRFAQYLVAMTTPPDGLVLDPFAGNATTGVAARRLGRRFVGIEIQEGYAAAGRARIAEDEGLLGAVATAVDEPTQGVLDAA